MMTSNVRNLLGITFTFALLSIALTSPALASEPETHDGFMLRFVTGLGYHHSSFDANGLTYSFDGMGAGGGLGVRPQEPSFRAYLPEPNASSSVPVQLALAHFARTMRRSSDGRQLLPTLPR